ncbi:MAG: collagen-like protein [Nitrososphaerota archaeon]|nr:collagen-like protein [Nitrososphaerota archaeon]
MVYQSKKVLTVFVICSMLLIVASVALVNAQTTPTLTLTSTDDNSIITLTGNGFDPSKTVIIKLQNPADNSMLYNFTETILTDENGTFTIDLSLPIGIYGTYNLNATTSHATATKEITLTGTSTLTASPDNSNIIQTTGTGFNANQTVTLQLTNPTTGTIVYNFTETITTNTYGNFSTIVIIPTSLSGNFSLLASTSTTTANTTLTVPNFTGPTGADGTPGITGPSGTDGAPGTPADSTFSYILAVLSVVAIVTSAFAFVKKR